MHFLRFSSVFLTVISLHADILLRDSFESASTRWRSTWGRAVRSQEKARTGQWSVKETLEDKHGLSVWYMEFDAVPGAVYTATAWVYVPTQDEDVSAALTIATTNWQALARATTKVKDKWVRLQVVCGNSHRNRLRLQLFQNGQKAGRGGMLMYWDDVTLERKLPEMKMNDGIRINPHVLEGLEVTALGGMKLSVASGKMEVDGRVVEVAATILELRPPRVVAVRGEAYRLTDEKPHAWRSGTPLRGCKSHHIPLPGILAPESLVVKASSGADAVRYVEGKDWRADKEWAQLGRLPDGRIGLEDQVWIDYDYGMMRMDTIEVRDDGSVRVREGNEHRMVPHPSVVDHQARALCTVFLPYHCVELKPEHLYPVGPAFPAAGDDEYRAKAALIPKSRAKLAAGEDFTLLFWGDSVTCGGDSSCPETAFPLAFTNWLRAKYPRARIKYVNAGTGGWNSRSKLPLFEQEVLVHKPDLMVIEFVNDMGMGQDLIEKNYTDAIGRVRALGGEAIILTPHFTRPAMMGGPMRTKETRATVGYLKEFARENAVGLADASRRWEHLWIEGVPYLTLLVNGINHPDDRGHALFVEELKLFFQTPDPETDPSRQFDMPPAK
ncbi:MAG: SGNH/GDSL hydrolase family protein [Lentisphaeria bacterium]|nr:SGNH/GDSL hydrolase family protein [Lentisphaeria bacterium]